MPYGKDESPEAVIWLTTTDENAIRRLGEELREWVSNVDLRFIGGDFHPVVRILGLERMLEGKCPEVDAANCLGFSISKDPRSWIEHVAVVVARRDAWEPRLAASFYNLIDQSGVARADSYVQYCYHSGR